MVAILSDIHSNLYALEAVLKDMPKVSDVYVLGDIVGGASPFPCEVLDRLMDLDVPVHAVLGNWEEWMLKNRHDIQPQWRVGESKFSAAIWTIDALQSRHWDFLEKLGKNMQIDDMLLFHGSPEETTGQILCQSDADELAKKYNTKWLIGGHTHSARLFRVEDGRESRRVVNVGSVGLSADGIGGTACYALLDGDNIVFRNVSYDVETAIRAIESSELYTLATEYSRQIIARMISG